MTPSSPSPASTDSRAGPRSSTHRDPARRAGIRAGAPAVGDLPVRRRRQAGWAAPPAANCASTSPTATSARSRPARSSRRFPASRIACAKSSSIFQDDPLHARPGPAACSWRPKRSPGPPHQLSGFRAYSEGSRSPTRGGGTAHSSSGIVRRRGRDCRGRAVEWALPGSCWPAALRAGLTGSSREAGPTFTGPTRCAPITGSPSTGSPGLSPPSPSCGSSPKTGCGSTTPPTITSATVRLADDAVTIRELFSYSGGVDNPAPGDGYSDTVPTLASLSGPVLPFNGPRGADRPGATAATRRWAAHRRWHRLGYAQAAARLVLSPLGMTSSTFPASWPHDDPDAVTDYGRDPAARSCPTSTKLP